MSSLLEDIDDIDPEHERLEAVVVRRDARIAQQARRMRALTNLVNEQQREIEDARDARAEQIPVVKPAKTKGAYSRVIIPDTHGCYIDQRAAAAFLSDLDKLEPLQIVLLGDHIDCSGFLATHHSPNAIASARYTFAEDVASANQFLDEVQKRAPNANYHYLEGNHENRIERWVSNQKLITPADAELLFGLFSPEVVLHLKKRKIAYYRTTQSHEVDAPGTIRLGDCYFVHGITTSVHAAYGSLNNLKANVVFGHTHRADSRVIRSVGTGTIGAWCPGCLCQLQPNYIGTKGSGWTHGYGVQLVQPDGTFLHINVPIIDGKSLLLPLTEHVSKGRKRKRSA